MVKKSIKNQKKNLIKTKKNNSKNKKLKGGGSNTEDLNFLVHQLYRFLKSSEVNKIVDKLIFDAENPLELYKSLRKDTEKEKNGRYILSLTPDNNKLWLLCQKEFKMNNEFIYEYNYNVKLKLIQLTKKMLRLKSQIFDGYFQNRHELIMECLIFSLIY